jgi:PAS domain S-box-containing protein
MSDAEKSDKAYVSGKAPLDLEAENKRLLQQNQTLTRQAQDVAKANALAAELMVQLEEANEHLEAEIERRKTAERELRHINQDIELKIQQRTAELTMTNVRLQEEISQREQMEQTLQEHKQRLDTILNSLLTGVVIVDAQTHEIVDVNPLAEITIGLPRDQIIGKVCHQLICPAEEGKCPISDLGQTVDKSERILLRPNGQDMDILKTVTTAVWQGREYLVESFIDISEQKKVEKERARLLEQLEKSNRELKDFASIVSHDLKAPLRGIKTLIHWIAQDNADRLDEDTREQMSLLTRRVERMHNLIDGILQYSRISRNGTETTAVDLKLLIEEVIDGIAPPDSIHIAVEGNLPVIQCEAARMTQIFQNLISNAVKYMDKPEGKITIGCVEEADDWIFSITDNGPGIEERYFEQIFSMFQTLSTRDEFESSGIGLTVVKKIIEMYGGTIWVTSQVGQGSTFSYKLPKQLGKIEEKEPISAGA